MNSTLNDHELTVLVEAAAEGATTSRANHGRGLQWASMGPMQKNAVREAALPFIYHGTKALADLGWERRRVIHTEEGRAALKDMTVVRSAAGTIANVFSGRAYFFGAEQDTPVDVLALPLVVLFEQSPES